MGLIKSEFQKIYTLPINGLLALIAFIVLILFSVSFLSGVNVTGIPEGEYYDLLLSPIPYVSVPLSLLSANIVCSEYQGNQFRTSIIVYRSKQMLLRSQCFVLIIISFLFGFLSTFASIIFNVIFHHFYMLSIIDMVALSVRVSVYYSFLFLIVGLLASIIRKILVVMAIIIVESMVVAPLIIDSPFSFISPTNAGASIWFNKLPEGSLSAFGGIAVLFSWLFILGFILFWVDKFRDA